MAAKLHFPENALALHLLLEDLERLIDVVVANNYLHEQTFICATKGRSLFKMAGGISEVPRDVEGVGMRPHLAWINPGAKVSGD
jgi:hypothetical protein